MPDRLGCSFKVMKNETPYPAGPESALCRLPKYGLLVILTRKPQNRGQGAGARVHRRKLMTAKAHRLSIGIGIT